MARAAEGIIGDSHQPTRDKCSSKNIASKRKSSKFFIHPCFLGMDNLEKSVFLAFVTYIEKKSFLPLTSYVVEQEINLAPQFVQDQFKTFLNLNPEIISINREIVEIRDAYLKKEILKPKFANDLFHIAIATYANADVLVSWNFKHIVRFDKILLYNSVNLELGYRPIQIYSPIEVTKIEKD